MFDNGECDWCHEDVFEVIMCPECHSDAHMNERGELCCPECHERQAQFYDEVFDDIRREEGIDQDKKL